MIVVIDLAANLSAREISGPRVGWCRSVIGVHVHVGHTALDRREQRNRLTRYRTALPDRRE